MATFKHRRNEIIDQHLHFFQIINAKRTRIELQLLQNIDLYDATS